MCAVTTWPFFSFSRKVVLGRVSTTSPSIWIASSLDIPPLRASGARIGAQSALLLQFAASTSAALARHRASGGRERGGRRARVLAQQGLELAAGDGAAAKSREVTRGQLAIDHRQSVAPAHRDQVRERGLGGVTFAAEH